MKKLNKFFAILVALAMMATLCVMSAFAEDENPTSGTDMYITKTLQIPQGLSTVAETFTFTGVLDKVDGNDATEAEKTALNFDTSIAYAAGETDEDADGYIRKAVAFDPDSIAFDHAGVYEYTVTETAGSTEGMKYDDGEYKVTIRVKNGSTPGTFEVDSIVVENEEGQKVDVDDPGDDDQPTGGENQDGEKAASGADFTNTYTKIADDTDTDDPEDPDTPETEAKASFVIDKTVAGDYGDKTKQFNFTLTIDTSKTYVATPTITVKKNGNAITPENNVYSFTLADGEEVVVEGAPVGTLYTVTEDLAGDTDAAAAKYTAAVEVKEDGAASDKSVAMPAERDTAREGANVVVTNALVGDDASYAKYTNRNTEDEVPPTGILMNNLPYIVLALVAIGGMVAYVVIRRREENNA